MFKRGEDGHINDDHLGIGTLSAFACVADQINAETGRLICEL